MANKHIMKILLQEKCAKENNVVKRLEKKKEKKKERKKKNMHAKFERKIIYTS